MDLNEQRARIEAERDRVAALADDFRAEFGQAETDDGAELSDYDQHPADTATETFEREKDVSILEQLEEELAELQAALERIDNGTYGVDEVTGQPIAPERLEARPTARTNVDTEGQREGDGRLPRGAAGDPEEY